MSILQGILKLGEHAVEYPGCNSGLATTGLCVFQQVATTTPANPSGKKKIEGKQ